MTNYQKTFETAVGGKFRPGNSVQLLQNGNEIFPAMLEAIRSAETSIEFVTFVLWHSKVATEFAEALCERAKAGVRVSFLIDAVGGATMSTRTIGKLERSGVKVGWFRPIRVGHLRRFNFRTHRKILIVDGRIGFTGGVGIADQWDGDAGHPKNWRETHVRIDGPACLDLFPGFAEEWREASHVPLPEPSKVPDEAGHYSILTTTSELGPRPTPMEKLYTAALSIATSRIWITTAYFIPTPNYVALLCTAAARGVDVQVLTNGPRTNHISTLYASRATYDVLINAGVRIYEYQPTVLHSKVLSLDKEFVSLGSANFDNRSLVMHEELNISIVDAGLAANLDRRFKRDLQDAVEVTAKTRLNRRWYDRMLEASFRTISNQL